MSNQIKTVLLLGTLTAIIIWFGNLIGGQQGMLIALIMAATCINFFPAIGFRTRSFYGCTAPRR